MAASSSIITPMMFLALLGMKLSVIKIAVPTPSGIAINSERNEVIAVP